MICGDEEEKKKINVAFIGRNSESERERVRE
jgi:hypothetical protein